MAFNLIHKNKILLKISEYTLNCFLKTYEVDSESVPQKTKRDNLIVNVNAKRCKWCMHYAVNPQLNLTLMVDNVL